MAKKTKDKPVAVRVGTEQKEMRCVACQNGRFFERKILLPSRTAAFLDLEWLGREARCFVCSECLYMHWFALR